jgi:hypothetical protein
MHVVSASVSALAAAPEKLSDTNTEFGAHPLVCLQPRLVNRRTPNGAKIVQAVDGRMSVDLQSADRCRITRGRSGQQEQTGPHRDRSAAARHGERGWRHPPSRWSARSPAARPRPRGDTTFDRCPARRPVLTVHANDATRSGPILGPMRGALRLRADWTQPPRSLPRRPPSRPGEGRATRMRGTREAVRFEHGGPFSREVDGFGEHQPRASVDRSRGQEHGILCPPRSERAARWAAYQAIETGLPSASKLNMAGIPSKPTLMTTSYFAAAANGVVDDERV